MTRMYSESRLHVFETEDRPGISAGLVVATGDSRKDAKTMIRDDHLVDDPEHDDEGHMNPDEHYAGFEYHGTLADLRETYGAEERLFATGISTAKIAGDIPTKQCHQIYELLRKTVRGNTQIKCLNPECRASRAHLRGTTVTDEDLQCSVCESTAVIAVQPESLEGNEDESQDSGTGYQYNS